MSDVALECFWMEELVRWINLLERSDTLEEYKWVESLAKPS